MKAFIDCGANDSCSARVFRSLYDPDNEYHIYSFEIEPIFINDFKDLPNLTFINKAVWIEDGTELFYRDKEKRHVGGSLIKAKKTSSLDKARPLVVETIDFSKWIQDTFVLEDEILLKMDIEGSEYAVLEKMLDDGIFDEYDIKKLFIEWHWSKVKFPEERHNKLVSRITIPIEKWDAAFGKAKKILSQNPEYVKISKRYRR